MSDGVARIGRRQDEGVLVRQDAGNEKRRNFEVCRGLGQEGHL